MSEPKNKGISPWIPLIVAVALVAGIFIGRGTGGQRGTTAGTDKLSTIMAYIGSEYVDEVDLDSLLETVYPELLSGLDPHSVYIPASDLTAVNDELEGSFSGIGISFNMMTDTITVIEIISGGPAEAVGLMPGDRIISIDDTVVAGQKWSNEKVISHLRGTKGTKVKVGVQRSTSDELLPFEITRGDIPVNSVDAAYMIAPGVGYVRVNKFGKTTFDEFFSSVMELKSQNAEQLVVDLRGNGGGFMEMAILMANEFLEHDAPIVSTKGRVANSSSASSADGSGALQDIGLVVLMDEYSASASEIFAGAMQDNDRGLVVGRRSFGKGLVQRQYDLPDNSAIRLTVARYYTPSGRSIQKRYEPGSLQAYQEDLIDRYDRGELFSEDSVKLDKSITFYTRMRRPVYGGGGIMPDVFVPEDTTAVTSWYAQVVNGGTLQKYSFDYYDRHRQQLSGVDNVDQLLSRLPDDDALLADFAEYAERAGVPQRWYYINISKPLVVNQLKALIARNALGVGAYYEVSNRRDPMVNSALEQIRSGRTAFPIK